MTLFKKKKKDNPVIDMRRNDYLASIMDSISEAKNEVAACKELEKQALDLMDYCKQNKLRKFKKVAQLELRLIQKKKKFFERYQGDLLVLYEKACTNTPGSR